MAEYPFQTNGGGGGGLVSKSCPTLVTPWTAANQAPLSLGLPFLNSFAK